MKAKYFALTPAKFKLDGGAMYGIIPKPLWEKKSMPDEMNRIDLALRCLCIEVGNKLILIDTGIGDYHSSKFNEQFVIRGPSHPLLQSLKKIGKNCDDITDVIISHLHFDHVGGLGHFEQEEFSAVFKNATYHLHSDHYQYSKAPTERDRGSFLSHTYLPLIAQKEALGKVHWCQGEEGIILSEGNYQLQFKISKGHTPYLMHPFDQEWIYLADLIPTSAHLSLPWVMGYDISPGICTVDKKEMLNFVVEKNLKIFFEHDPQYFGAIIKKERINEKDEFVAQKLFEEITEIGGGYQIPISPS